MHITVKHISKYTTSTITDTHNRVYIKNIHTIHDTHTPLHTNTFKVNNRCIFMTATIFF